MTANYIMVFSRNCNNQHGEISVRKSCSYMLTLPQSVLNSAGSRPLDKGGGGVGRTSLQKKSFRPFGPQFGLKISVGGWGGKPLPWIRQ